MAADPQHLSILRYPAAVLRRRSDPIDSITDEVRAVAARMLELMRQAEGIGLAAPQVGLPWRLFVTAEHEDHPARIYINPTLHDPLEEAEAQEEGCLSLPGVHVEVRRPRGIAITALDLEGEAFTLSATNLLARVWQHETDHLNGVLIIDRMGPMDRLANRKAIKELESLAQI